MQKLDSASDLAAYFDKSQCYNDWQMVTLLDQQMSIFPVWQMATYPIWHMQILPNCLYVVAHGSSKTAVYVEGMHKSSSSVLLLLLLISFPPLTCFYS